MTSPPSPKNEHPTSVGRQLRVALFPTCLVDAVRPEVGVSTVRLLRRLGAEVVVPEGTTCCGQPAWNAGHAEAAAEVARTTARALDDGTFDLVVVPAGSCATMMRVFWQELFHLTGDPEDERRAARVSGRVRELSELLTELGLPAVTAPTSDEPTAYHRSCHMLRELRITDEPERLLDAVGTSRTAATEDRCCGFGGTFAVKLPEVSTAMADEVLDAVLASGTGRMVGCDTSCLMHLQGRAARRDLDLTFDHLACVLDEATAPDAAASGR